MEKIDCPIFLINLKDKEDHLLKSIKEIRKLELFDNIILKEAIDREKAKLYQYKYITKHAFNNIEKKLEDLNTLPTWGSVGCAISHINCWKDIIKNNYKYAIICEDDIKVNNVNNFKYCYYDSLKIINNQGPTFISFNSKVGVSYHIEEIQTINGTFTGTSFYLLNLECANKLLNMIPLTQQIDVSIGYNIYQLQLNAFFYRNSGISNYDHLSTVQYYFIKYEDLFNELEEYFPEELIIKIYEFLPKKEHFKKNYYGYNNYGYNNYMDYHINILDYHNNL